MKTKFHPSYVKLEKRVLSHLRKAILKSKQLSKHTGLPMIPVNVFDYTEMFIINNDITFSDKGGYHYSLYADASLEDLIEIADKL